MISSSGGSISVGTEVTELPAYGVTKAAANYLVRKIHFEHENLSEHTQLEARFNLTIPGPAAFAFCPGGVATDMGAFTLAIDAACQSLYLICAAIFVKSVNPTIDTNFPFKGPELTATALLGQIDAAARETYGGKFRSWDGAEIPW